MTAQELVFRFLCTLEGLRLHAYPDSTGTWTIGFGHTRGVKRGDVCDYEQAFKWFLEDTSNLLLLVKHLPTIPAAMLVSFGYNCGISQLKRILSKEIKVVPDGFRTPDGKLYGITSRGKPSSGLDNRRKLEAALLLASGFSN